MNRLIKAVFQKIAQEKGELSAESCVLKAMIEYCSQSAFEYIDTSVLKEFSIKCSGVSEKLIMQYFVEKLRLFDFNFRLLIEDDKHIDIDYHQLQLYLIDEFVIIDNVKYSRSYIGENTFVFLTPRMRFRRLL